MRVSLRWLSDYVPLTLSAKALAERLTLAGVKVERIISQGDDWQGIRVATVEDVEPHPNADRLRLVTVNLNGDGEQPKVVCGAPNVAVGQKIAFGSVGARVRDGHTGEWTTLKPAKIRGVDSAGMVLSEMELGLSEEHEGILVLPDDAPVGQPLAEYLGDTIFDIEVTPNRPDMMSMLGIAWEAAAQTHVKVKEPGRVYSENATTTAAQRTSVTIEDKDLCPRYLAGIVERVKVGDSPEWLQTRLRAAGMRPINNVVDITNYVMLEMGQPLHAFDFRKLGGQRIVVRRARNGERLRTLDGADRQLRPDMLVIADASKAVAVAGVMGGSDAEVSAATTTILLEAASFNPISIRSTSSALGLRSEASIRFERGLHPELAAIAAKRAMKLLVEIAGGRAAKGLVDVYPGKAPDTRVTVTRRRVEQVLGWDLPTSQVRTALMELGFTARVVPPDRYVVRSPYWRTDVNQADDVVEELARVIGYDRIETLPLAGAMPPPVNQPVRRLRERLRDAAVAAGLQEVISYPLTTTDLLASVQAAEALEVHPPLRLENPMSSEMAVMRNSLRASLLQSVSANLRRERGTVAFFEAARAYLSRQSELPDEREVIVAAIGGQRIGRWGQPSNDPLDFFDAKGILEEVLERSGIDAEFKPTEEYAFLRGNVAAVHAGEEQAGIIGQVHPQLASRFDIEGPVFLFELDVEKLLPAVKGVVRHQSLSRFPAVIQDIAILVDLSIEAGQVARILEASPLVVEAKLFDVYEGPPMPEGKRSLAYAVQFQALDRTLTVAEVAEARGRIIRRLQHDLSAELRGA